MRKNKVHFKLVVPAFNCENWIEKCLFSIKNQVHQDFECIIYNDASTDNTGAKIDNFLNHFDDPRFRVVHNDHNQKALHNIVEGFKILKSYESPDAILAVVDGDDYLFCEYSLALINQAYEQRNDLMLTYGSFVMWPTGELSFPREFPQEIIKRNDYRKHPFISSHLRTFKSKLWNAIDDNDLRDVDGDYFKVGWDVSFMLPMLEMAAGRYQYIPNILYVYNRWNPISDDVINLKEQQRVDKLIRTRSIYQPLT